MLTLTPIVIAVILASTIVFLWPFLDRTLRSIGNLLGKIPRIGFALQLFYNGILGLAYIPLSIVDTLRYLVVFALKLMIARLAEWSLGCLIAFPPIASSLKGPAFLIWPARISLYCIAFILFFPALPLLLFALFLHVVDAINDSHMGLEFYFMSSTKGIAGFCFDKTGFITRLSFIVHRNPLLVQIKQMHAKHAAHSIIEHHHRKRTASGTLERDDGTANAAASTSAETFDTVAQP